MHTVVRIPLARAERLEIKPGAIEFKQLSRIVSRMNKPEIELILASQSPRRAQLLGEAGYQFNVIPPEEHVEANASQDYPPEALVVKLAEIKAANVIGKLRGSEKFSSETRQFVVLAADTIAFCSGEILGKPLDRDHARRMLQQLSGKRHDVLTGVCLWDLKSNHHLECLERTQLEMKVLSEEQLANYLTTDAWQGKAGAFGYQDGLDWVHIVKGLASNVVGLPVERIPLWLAQLEALPGRSSRESD
jgi:septum formation protein